ncbi:MAG: 3-hydroxyacyl-CoA dehydrogenase NAD-binding domain-containing protein, partial [Pseudomonadota bacterium]|nr:3-hydroxyacyl-CoA dehydrogenase NAD-binding domain-containing protein [Pseudomonadota bacterium]
MTEVTSAASGATHWRLEQEASGIAWLIIDKANAAVNSLSREVMEELDAILTALTRTPPTALIVTSAKNGFIAGADIKGFVGIDSPDQAYDMIRQGQQVIDKLAALRCVSVAAINGFALGGGLEVALACRYRVAADDPSVTLGFPEVQLGVHPGLGGTVRAVQLAGPIAAMDLMLTGRHIRPKQALQMGLVDKLAPPAQLREIARQVALDPPPMKRPSLKNRLLNSGLARPILAGQMRSQVARKARPEHYPAPYKLIELWQEYGSSGQRAYEAEARSMAHLLCTPTSRNLVRVFFLQERLKSAGKSGSEPLKHVHVIGAGVMGGDIASWCAARGLTVTLQDREEKYVAPALERARKFFDKRYPDQAKRDEVSARLTADVAGAGVPRADLVIEAIFENLQAKQELYARVEPQLKPNALLATNTSSIVLEQLAEKLAQPERLIGLHFFN